MREEILNRWSEQEIPDHDGLICYNEDIPEFNGWQDFVINQKLKIEKENMEILCGECSGHGSIGAIVACSMKEKNFLWSFLSSDSNPFVSIEQNNEDLEIRSSSGVTFVYSPARNPTEFKLKRP